MPTPRRRSSSRSTPAKLAELGVAAPFVASQRIARMMLAGPLPSARDRREFGVMVSEKQRAFVQSWSAMFGECLRLQQAVAQLWLGAAAGVAGKGLAPVHRKAVANARRLARRR